MDFSLILVAFWRVWGRVWEPWGSFWAFQNLAKTFHFTPNGLNPSCAKDLGRVGECFGRDFGGLGEGFGTFWEDFERSGHFGRSWGYFGLLFWVFCMYFQAFYAILHVLSAGAGCEGLGSRIWDVLGGF